jgi:hypothetical protein
MDESGAHRERMLARAAGPGTRPRINTYDHFREGQHLRHDQYIEWDGYEGTEERASLS